ncbi:hypothetical protein AB0K00_02160 [Dactylosporangium sp. NPDC049525]|jgi:hypothetical protein|uniref:hypothetical protein n=1 Tax=unclassified Dactylosporangium TaxID=2621675 RepID=UPI002E0FCE59|nr:hypothetical protein OHA72_07895 [Dactylosporangium sp. NBC_01737]
MNNGPDNFGNGSSKTDDRFSGQLGSYRPGGRRDVIGDGPIDDLSPRNGSPLDRPSSPLDRASLPLDNSPIAASLTPPKLPESSLVADLGPLTEPMFGRSNVLQDSWLDGPSGSMADHPLLRGLLLELPPKGTMPQQEWLDRWFEAARSILELIYSQEARGLK